MDAQHPWYIKSFQLFLLAVFLLAAMASTSILLAFFSPLYLEHFPFLGNLLKICDLILRTTYE